MSWSATGVAAAWLWAMAASAQTPPPGNVAPPWPGARPDATQALRKFMKDNRLNIVTTTVCSIPLIEVPVSKNVERMPVMRPRKAAGTVRTVPLPAPPCKEEQR